MPEKINISISGYGIMWKNHKRICESLGEIVNNIFDPKEERFSSYDTFLNNVKDSKGVIISSPTKFHKQNLVDILNINPKIKILIEKPCFYSSEESKDIKEDIINSNSILVGQIERFNPVVKKLKSILKPDDIIQIKTSRLGNVPSREKIDCRKDIGIHDLDFSTYIKESTPKELNIQSNLDNTHEFMSYKIGKTLVQNEVSWCYPYKERSFSILTKNGVYKGNFFHQTLFFIDWTGQETNIFIDKKEPLVNEISHFLNMIKVNENSICTINDNLSLIKLLGY